MKRLVPILLVLVLAVVARADDPANVDVHLSAPLPVLLPPSTVPSTTMPADEPPLSLEQAKAKEKAEMLADLAQVPVITVKSISDVITLSLQNKMLSVNTPLPATNDHVVVRIPGVGGITTFRVTAKTTPDAPITAFAFDHFDFDAPDCIYVHTSILQSTPQLMISQAAARLDDEAQQVELIQSALQRDDGELPVTLHVQVTAHPAVDLHYPAESIVDLRRRHPAEVAKFVDPIFTTLRQHGLLTRVDSKLAWQVFSDAFEPSAELRAKIKPLLAQLGAENFRDREAALEQLEALGQPAALTLMQWDRHGMSDEQVGRLDAFLAAFKQVDDAQRARLKSDTDFLLDCLASDELPLRRRALEALRKATGKPIEFDLEAESVQRIDAIARLRGAVGAVPATQAKLRDADEVKPAAPERWLSPVR